MVRTRVPLKPALVALTCAAVMLGGRCARESASAAITQGKLAFVANVSGNWELFLLTANQAAPTRLTQTALDERAPSISPDGTRIAYVTSDGSLWLMQVDTRETRQLGAPPTRYGYPTWTPDGRAIVYTVYTYAASGEDADLFHYTIADKKQRLLVQQTGPQDFAAMSRAGNHISYISSVATLVPQLATTVTQQLWVVSLRDGSARQLISGTFRETRPAWSPDDKSIACSSDRGGTPDIWLIESEGRNPPVQLTDGPGAKTSPAWSPDGKEVAYVVSVDGRSELMAIEIASRRARRLPVYTSGAEIRDPSWR
jgi:TolB protein